MEITNEAGKPLGLRISGIARVFTAPRSLLNQPLTITATNRDGLNFLMDWTNKIIEGDSDRTLVVSAPSGETVKITAWLHRGLGSTSDDVMAYVNMIETPD